MADIIPTISVVIPLYNKEKYIQRTLDSVLAQKFQGFEVVVVNDGSTDDGPEIVKNFDDPRIRLINQENAGVSAARNRGIKEAKAELIAFLDADDEWELTFLATINTLIHDYPQAGLYTTGYRVITINNREKRATFKSIAPDYVGVISNYFINVYDDPIVTSDTAVIPRFVFDDVGLFDERIRFGEDLLMWYRIALKNDIVINNSIHATYFQNATNRSSFKRKGANVECFRLFWEYYGLCKNNISRDKRKWAKRYNIYLLFKKCMALLINGEYYESCRLFSFLLYHLQADLLQKDRS